MNDRIPVLVTTQYRGVFFGWADPADVEDKAKIRLTQIRNCIVWSSTIGGFLGLAKTGPNADCRIGAEAPEAILHDITSCTICTEEAAQAWTSA
jgi:hypothetical protein